MRRPSWWESIGIIAAILTCIAAYLALPQVQFIIIGQPTTVANSGAPIVGITVASATSTPTSTPTVVPSSPIIDSNPPKGNLHYSVRTMSAVWGLMYVFLFMDRSPSMSKGEIFCKSHPELSIEALPCDSASSMVIGTLEMHWDELNPVTLAEAQKRPDTPIWLTQLVNEDTIRIKGLGLLYELKGQWVLVRGMWQKDGFKIDPRDFVFVWNYDRWQYEQIQ